MVLSATLLGISSSTPLKDRNTTSLAVKYEGELILFDAGESVQQQLMKTKLSNMAIDKIFISHFHADHFLGLPGLLATMSLHKRNNPITIFGPKGVKERVKRILEEFEIALLYKLEFVELKNGIVFENDNYTISARRMNHLIETYGFVFKEKDSVGKFVKEKALALGIPEGHLYAELKSGKAVEYKGKIFKPTQVMDYASIKKGKSIGYVVDCSDKNYEDFVEGTDILFHETCFAEKDKEQAKKTRHSLTTDVANIAKDANVKKLVIMNFSPRYSNLSYMLHEVQKIFPDAEVGQELKTYILH